MCKGGIDKELTDVRNLAKENAVFEGSSLLESDTGKQGLLEGVQWDRC